MKITSTRQQKARLRGDLVSFACCVNGQRLNGGVFRDGIAVAGVRQDSLFSDCGARAGSRGGAPVTYLIDYYIPVIPSQAWRESSGLARQFAMFGVTYLRTTDDSCAQSTPHERPLVLGARPGWYETREIATTDLLNTQQLPWPLRLTHTRPKRSINLV